MNTILHLQLRRCPSLANVSFAVISIFILMLFFNTRVAGIELEAGTRFVVVGHLYPLMDDLPHMEEIYNKINLSKPEFVFILGDSRLHKEEVVKTFREKVHSKVYFAPGNQELSGVDSIRKQYLDNVGYYETVAYADDFQFILINSSDNSTNLSKFLESSFSKLYSDKLTVLFTHHRIWDDSILSEGPFGHDKSYLFSEIHPVLKGRVQYIFSGNSKRQYFTDRKSENPKAGKQNVDNIYWCDVVGEIQCISAGMGDGYPKAGFLIVDVVNGKLLITADYLLTKKKQAKIDHKIKERTSDNISDKTLSTLRSLGGKKFYGMMGLLIGILLGIAVYYIFLKCCDIKRKI